MSRCGQYGDSSHKFNNNFQMVVDQGVHSVTVGDWVFDSVVMAPAKEGDFEEKNACLLANGIEPPELEYCATEETKGEFGGEVIGPDWGEKLRAAHTSYANHLGARFNYRLYGAMFNAWCGWMPREAWPFLHQDGYRWKYLHRNTVEAARHAKPYVLETINDGLLHLVPAVISFGAPPGEIKKAVGKATWKKIAANSKTRNHKISQMHFRSGESAAAAWAAGVQMRSFCLHRSGAQLVYGSLDQDIHASRIAGACRAIEFDSALQLIRDASRMGVYNPEWSLRRLTREHDRAAEIRAHEGYPSKPFCADQTATVDGFTFTRVTSQSKVAAEGGKMRHCVAAYARDCQRGVYAVYAVDGPERATLGVRLNGTGRGFDQIYGACNKRVSDRCRAAAMDFLHDVEFESAWAA